MIILTRVPIVQQPKGRMFGIGKSSEATTIDAGPEETLSQRYRVCILGTSPILLLEVPESKLTRAVDMEDHNTFPCRDNRYIEVLLPVLRRVFQSWK